MRSAKAPPAAPPVTREVVLAGAGAAHLVALRGLARRPFPADTRVTFVTREAEAIYSGMLPGVLAGRLARTEATMDLPALAAAAGARWIMADAAGLDLSAGRLLRREGPPLRFDLLSLSLGTVPALVPGAAEHALALRPLDAFLDAWERLLAETPRPGRLLVVGGGAAGVEVALAAARALGGATAVSLLCRGERPLPRHAPTAGRQAARLLAEAGVAVRAGAEVARVEAGAAVLAGNGERVFFDRAIWAGGSAPPAWLAESGLDPGPGGSLAVDDCLRTSDPRVFAAGDMATMLNHPRERAGVYAVRQGEPLLDNLRRVLDGKAPRPHRPQRVHLALLLAGERALATRGGWFAGTSRAALWLKDRIDRRWVESFRMPPAMPRPAAADAMRCGGCGAKLPPAVLSRVLARLPRSPSGGAVPLGLEAPDDAALLASPTAPGRLLVQSVDHLRGFIGDPWRMGRVAAVHAMGDVAAMGGVPRAALAIAVLPPAGETVLEADLYAMLLGGSEALAAEGAGLAGGHSAEGMEAAIGFAVTGEVDADRALRRSGLRAGDALLLTGPLGTGAVLAAAMRGRARGRWLAGAVAAMERSPFPASRALLAHDATACADVTGFGLLGHLLEMLRASGVGAEVDAGAVPALEGALEALRAGVRSTLHPGNEAHARPHLDGADALPPERLALLLDPQTAGGLLAGVPAERAEACLAALREAGDARAAVIGRVVSGPPRVQLATFRPGASLVPG